MLKKSFMCNKFKETKSVEFFLERINRKGMELFWGKIKDFEGNSIFH